MFGSLKLTVYKIHRQYNSVMRELKMVLKESLKNFKLSILKRYVEVNVIGEDENQIQFSSQGF